MMFLKPTGYLCFAMVVRLLVVFPGGSPCTVKFCSVPIDYLRVLCWRWTVLITRDKDNSYCMYWVNCKVVKSPKRNWQRFWTHFQFPDLIHIQRKYYSFFLYQYRKVYRKDEDQLFSDEWTVRHVIYQRCVSWTKGREKRLISCVPFLFP